MLPFRLPVASDPLAFCAASALIVCAGLLALPTNAATETVLYSFCSQGSNCLDGQTPLAALNDAKGIIYGTTFVGGTCGLGTAFSLDPKTGALTTLHSFCRPHLKDGSHPGSDPTYVHGTLYGTTEEGGSYHHQGLQHGAGTLFSIDPVTGSEKLVYRFQDGNDGAVPTGHLVQLSGTLYGTTRAGGNQTGGDCYPGCGTIFSLDPSTGVEKGLYVFCSQQNCTDGAGPDAGVNHVNGILYGTTSVGGAYNLGTVFSLDPASGVEKVLYSFGTNGNADGDYPYAGLVNINGILYGTTYFGGTNEAGTVFSLDLATNVEKVVFSFCSQNDCSGGRVPVYGPLIQANGVLYGTTEFGGTNCGDDGCGTVFSVDPATGKETALYSFCNQTNCTDGAEPLAGLVDMNGTLYGTTFVGGAHNAGTVFAITP